MPDGKSWLEYAIPGASAAFGLGGSIMNYFSQRENRQNQIDLMREQNAFNERMMNKQMDWNSESAKVQRLAAAGLNPSLAFSDASNLGSAAVGAAVPTLQAPQNNFSDVALNAAQAINLLSGSNLSNEQAKGQSIDNMYRDAYNMILLDQMDSQRGLNDVERAYYRALETINSRSAQSQVEGFALANEKTRFEMDVLDEQAQNLHTNTAYQDALRQLAWKEDEREADRLKHDIKLIFSQMRLNEKMGGMYEKQGDMFGEQGKMYGKQAKYYNNMADKAFEEKLFVTAQKNLAWMDEKRFREIYPYIKQEYESYAKSSALRPLNDAVEFLKGASQLVNPLWHMGYPLGGGANVNFQGGSLNRPMMRKIGF